MILTTGRSKSKPVAGWHWNRFPGRRRVARGTLPALAVLTMLAALLVAGCAQGPDYRRPNLGESVPADYAADQSTTVDAAGAATGAAATDASTPRATLADSTGLVSEQWWSAFDDTTLNRLVDDALRHNHDLAQAVARVLEARALHGGSAAARWPSVEIGGAASRSKTSFNLPTGSANFYTNQFSAAATFRYELDLWGRLSRAEQAAYATLLASEQNRRTVVQTLIADVVRTWLLIREQEAQLALTERTIASFRDNLAVVEDRYLHGLVPALDLRLARQNLATALAQLPQNQQDLAEARRRLEILVGRYPAGRVVASDPGYEPSVMPDPLPPVPAGLPSTLLERRPDLAAAELQLASVTARIGEAKAALFPRIALTADGGTRSPDLDDLFTSSTSVWSLVANLTMPLINRGAVQAQIKANEARTAQAASAYRAAVLNAFREVESALDAGRLQTEREVQLRTSVLEARRSLELAEERYRRGLDNLIVVLDTQRRLYNAEAAMLITQRLNRTARVNLILALGGPWDLADAPSALEIDAKQVYTAALDGTPLGNASSDDKESFDE